MDATSRAKFRIQIRLDAFRRECKRAHLVTDAEIAKAFRMNRATVWRITSGRQAVSADFIAAALAVLYRARFDELFDAGGAQ